MKKTLKNILTVISIVCVSVLVAAIGVSASTPPDYGLEVFGNTVSSSYKSNENEGWSFDPATNTITITDGAKFTAAFEKMAKEANETTVAFKEYRPNIGRVEYAYYIAAVEVKSLSNLTVRITDEISIGNSNWGSQSKSVVSDSPYNVYTYGFYSPSGGITVTGGGKLTVYSTESAFYANGYFNADKVDLDLNTYNTAAIYAQGKILINNSSKVFAKTNYLGGIYESYSSLSDYSKSKNGTVRYDSMAAVLSAKGTYANGITVANNSELKVTAKPTEIFEDERKLTLNKEKMPEGFEKEYSDGTRAYYSVWADSADITVREKSNLIVNMNPHHNLYKWFDPRDGKFDWLCLFRTIAVNASSITAIDSYIEVTSNCAGNETLGHDPYLFSNQTFYYPSSGYTTDNSLRGSMFYFYGASSMMLNMGLGYGSEADAQSNFYRLLDTDSADFDFKETYNSKNYYLTKYTDTNHRVGLYMYLKSYEKGPTYYLRKNGNQYEYSEYFDFRSGIKQISSNTLDIAALGWSDKTLHIKSGDYTIKLPVNNNLKIFDGSESSTITIKLEGGKTYNGSYDMTFAGKLIVEGDGIIKELWTHKTMELDWEGDPGIFLLREPEFYVKSGTIAGGSSGGVHISVQGGNVAFNEDMQSTYVPVNSRTLKRITIDLGEYADIFTSDMLRMSSNFPYDTTGIYPIDGKIYFWEHENKLGFVGDHPSQMAFNHLEITDDYTYYVYPKRATDSEGNVINRQFTLYRLPERTEVFTTNDGDYFASGTEDYAKNVTLDSFYYAQVVDRPAYDDPLYTEETKKTVLPGSKVVTPQNGDYVEWTCKDKDEKQITLGRAYDSLSLTAEKLHYQYHDYQCVLYSIDGTVKKTHNFDVHILVYYNTESKHADRGETVTFEAQYYTDGTWLEDYGFQWCWQWRAGSNASWNTVDDTDAFYQYTAFWESYENSAHCYQFRRVAYLNRINEESVFLPSPTMLLTMCAYITSAPEKVEILSNDPAESIDITVEATRAHYVWWGKKDMDGNNWAEIKGANSLTLSLPRSEYTDENGKWDPDKVNGIYTCSVYDMGYGSVDSVDIIVEVIDPPYFTSELPDKVTATDGLAYYTTNIGGSLERVNDIWWEYSLDDGSTWIKMMESDSSDSHQVGYLYSFILTESGFVGYFSGSDLEFNAAGIDAEKVLIRSGMDDNNSKTYYTNVSTLTFVDMPVISRQPQSQALNINLGTGYMDFAFEEPLPSEYTVSYQWQIKIDYGTIYPYWENINSNNKYTCNDQRIDFNLKNIASVGILTNEYRCKISFTDAEGTTIYVYTEPATLEIVKDHTHRWATEWTTDGTHHWHECTAKGCDVINNTDKPGYGAHSDTDDGDCTTAVVCECGYIITAANAQHSFDAWQSNGNNMHTHRCTVDGCNIYETRDCTGGQASYFKKAVCENCNTEYGNLLTDTKAPNGEISIGTNKWNSFLNTITFGIFFKDTQSVTITAIDDSYDHAGYADDKAVKVEYYLYSGDTALTQADLAGLTFTAYNGTFNINPDNKYVVYVRLTDHAGNVTYISSEGVVLDATAPAITGVTDGSICYTTQTAVVADENLESVTLNGVSVDGTTVTLDGNKDAVYTIVATDKSGNITIFTVTMKPISSLAESIDGVNGENVNSSNKDTIEAVKESVSEVDTSNATDSEKEALSGIDERCNELLDIIDKAQEAIETENIKDAEEINPDNVAEDDREALEKAKTDLEKALEDNGSNYTDDEKANIELDLERIDESLKVLDDVKAVEDLIAELPESVEPDDLDTVQSILNASDAYNALTDYEKSLVSKDAKEKLYTLTAGISAYMVYEGNGGLWTIGQSGALTFTANGAYSKFTGIKVDGVLVDAKYYTAKSGSTIISLNADYLNTLSAGTHTLTVLYTDGEAEAEFEVVKQAEAETEKPNNKNKNTSKQSPETGNDINSAMWLMLLLSCGGAIIVTSAYGKRKKQSR